MKRERRDKQKRRNTQEAQAKRTAYNKANPEETKLRREELLMDKLRKTTLWENRRLRKLRKKRIKRLKSLLKRDLITDEQYEVGIKTIKKGGN